jgi:hypothetical protein
MEQLELVQCISTPRKVVEPAGGVMVMVEFVGIITHWVTIGGEVGQGPSPNTNLA